MKKLKKLLKENVTYVYISIAFLVSFAFLVNVLFTIQLKFDNSALQNEIFELENRIKGVKQELQEAKTDANIEKQASQRLGMVKTGDTPVKIFVNEDVEEIKKQEEKNKTQDKLRIYIKDWYKDLSVWVKNN